jgi:hypothetical protein
MTSHTRDRLTILFEEGDRKRKRERRQIAAMAI